MKEKSQELHKKIKCASYNNINNRKINIIACINIALGNKKIYINYIRFKLNFSINIIISLYIAHTFILFSLIDY